MNKGGFLLYKCRKCGKIDKSIYSPNVVSTLIEVNVFGKDLKQNMCHMTNIHSCSKKVTGISDLIGCVEDK